MRIIRYTSWLLIIIIFMLLSSLNVFGKSGDYLRIGIGSLKNRDNIPVGNEEINVYYVLEHEFVEFGELSGSDLSVEKDDGYYAVTDYAFDDYDDAYEQCESFNDMDAVPALNSSGKWVVLLRGSSKNDASDYVDMGYAEAVIDKSDKRIAVLDGSETIAVFDNDEFTAYFAKESSDSININGKDYRGYLDAYPSGSGLSAVNVVDVEDYLCAAVPSEMPSGWHIEALKAQAVAARCYTYTRRGIHEDEGYDLCDGVHCQLYGGISAETDSSVEAVLETLGIGAFYDGKIINATFFSSSGGATEDAENVWTDKTPYLKGVTDEYETEAKEWTREFTLTELTELAEINGMSLGEVTGAAVKELSATGRVLELEIIGSQKSETLTKEDIRTFFAPSSGGSLESRNFMIGEYTGQTGTPSSASPYILDGNMDKIIADGEIVIESISNDIVVTDTGKNIYAVSKNGASELKRTGASPVVNNDKLTSSSGDVVVFSGRGWGHGAGLSQYGAKGMAEAGFDYEDILKHYYTGIELEEIIMED